MSSIFISHSQRDSQMRDFFAGIFGRTNVKANLVEYEQFQPPAWPHIQQQISTSAAMVVLLGPNMALLSHTQMWVGSESGAVPPPKEVWVFEHFQHLSDVPIPNTHHYMQYAFDAPYEQYIKAVIESYDDSPILPGAVGGGLIGALTGPPGIVVGAMLGALATNPSRNRPIGITVQCPNPNPPKDTDGRREDSGRGWVRELQGRWPGVLG